LSRSLPTRRIVPRRPQIPGCDNAYCKYAVVHGDDWTHLDGPEDGISQITRKTSGDSDQKLVWNFPVEVTYKSTNAFGWPQLILSVYSIDALGRDVIRGYGCVHLPIAAGVSVRKVPLYKPLSASLMQQFMAWVSGRPAEFSNPKFPAMGEGREVTRVQSTGYASVQLNVVTKDMAVFGYSEAKAAPGVAA
jgi:B9 domain-containing protein 1